MKHRTIILAASAAIFTGALLVTVWAAYPETPPTIDGDLEENEYATYGSNIGYWMEGDFSDLYTKYVLGEGGGLYVCNDWWNPDVNYDPNDECDGMNQFDWTDTGVYPNMYWRVKVHAGEQNINIYKRQNIAPLQEWDEVDPEEEGWYCVTGYSDSPLHEDPHPIWELKIPASEISSEIVIGLVDPKAVDPEDCPSVAGTTDARVLSVYGNAPSFFMSGMPTGCQN